MYIVQYITKLVLQVHVKISQSWLNLETETYREAKYFAHPFDCMGMYDSANWSV